MPNPIVYVDQSRVRAGMLDRLRGAMRDLVSFVQANEPQLLAYGFFLTEDGTRMSVVAVHPDSNSMEYHMQVAGPEFGKFAELIELETIDVFGKVSETVLRRLTEKAEMLGQGVVTVHRPEAGFARFGAR